MFPLLLVLSCRLSLLVICCHHLLHMNTTHCVWYVSFTTDIVMSSLSFRYLLSPSVAHEHYTLFVICFLYYGIVMSSLSFRYLISPSVAHEHDTLCMIGFFYHWYCHVVSLLYVFGITICCTRTWHIVYDMFLLLLVLSCRLSPLGVWCHHMLHTNMTHCVWYVSFTTGIVMSSLLLVFGIIICCTRTGHIAYDMFLLLLVLWCLSPLGSWYHHMLHTNTTHCVWYVSLSAGIFMSSHSFRYLVSPSVAHDNDTLCMMCFSFYWYCHVVSLL